MTAKPKRIPFRFMDAEIMARNTHTGAAEWIIVSLRHARLYNPMTDHWRWYPTLNDIPPPVMAHLWPEEREQVRRLLGMQTRSFDTVTYQPNGVM